MFLLKELNQTEDFYELLEKDEIIIYDEQNKAFTKMCRYMSENTCKLCVKDFLLLKRRLMFDLNIPELPVAIYYRHLILPNDPIKKLLFEINNIKFDLLELRVKNMIISNKIHVFIEDNPNTLECDRTMSLMNIINKLDMNNISFGWYNVLLNKRLFNYVCDLVRCRKMPLIFINGEFIGTLEIFEELFVQKKLDTILENIRNVS